ncbi:LysE family translocator [Sulfitobacter sp. LCG007]
MTPNVLAALAAFAFISTATPGPNNLMLMASGANFGYARTIPHMLGILCGFSLMILILGIGLMQIFDRFPMVYTVMRIASVGYLLHLAWRVAHAAPPQGANAKARPMTFLEAAAFQWVNPKAWAMGISANSLFATEATLPAYASVAAVFAIVTLPANSIWTILGQQVARLLTSPGRRTAFNWVMAGLLVGSLYPVLLAP